MSSVLEVQEVSVRPVSRPSPTVAAAPNYTEFRPLFSHSLLERSGIERRRRAGSAAFSLMLQSILVIVLVLLPLWFVDSLPMHQLVTFLAAPPPPPAPPPPAAPEVKVVKMVSQVLNGQLLAPSKIPRTVKMIKEEEAPPPAMGVAGGVIGGVPGGQSGGVIGSLLSDANRSGPPVAAEIPKRVRVSTGVAVGLLQKRVEPLYPMIALKARIQGTVQLHALISKEGRIENLQLIEGHPMLVEAAINAVRQWQYKPYQLSGEPVEVETTVSVNFHIDR
ncbi:MAG TPA: TonB family protein [Candidatus Angelobacter sp.]|nr:TonB family protein [Candidatus Angelobacter sp.]